MHKEKIWEEYFKPPFKFEELHLFMFDKNYQLVLMMVDNYPDKTLVKSLEDIMNGVPITQHLEGELTHANGEAFLNGNCLFLARGWGYLTSRNCRGLNEKVACEIQDAMLNHIIKELRG